MNKKSGNAWMLCPSKSFPGKFYYFNVITGEAAWCLTEDEKKTLAKDVSIKKVSDKNHSYPEPNTPPTDEGLDTSNICYNFAPTPNLPLSYQMGPMPIFGQPLFSRYIPNQYMPGYMVPMPQMIIPSKPEPKKRSFDQITQTDSQSDIQVPCKLGYTIPLSRRFGTYQQKNIGTKIFGSKCESPQNNVDTFTSNRGNWCKTATSEVNLSTMQGSIFGPKLNHCNEIKPSTSNYNLFTSHVNNTPKTYTNRLIKEPVLSLDRRESINVRSFTASSNQKTDVTKKSLLVHESKKEPKNIQITSHPTMNTEVDFCLKKPTFNAKNSTVNKENWVQNVKSVNFSKQPMQNVRTIDAAVEIINDTIKTEDDVDNTQSYLNNDDLRFVLQAKRRKLISCNMDTSVQIQDIFPSLTQQESKDLNKLKERIKQVRFDFENLKEAEENEDIYIPEESDVQTLDSENVIEKCSPTPQLMNISYLKSLAKPFMKTDPWYVVVDIGVLLDDFEFIENFVKKDTTCRLLVPSSVRSYIETMSVGEYGGRSWVMLARKAMRRLNMLENFVVLQPPIMESSTTSAIDGTIECCLQVLESNHAVLITTETELYTKGAAAGIQTFILDDIKKSVDMEPKLSFDQGINVEVQVDNNNIFMQNTDNFEVFPSSKDDCILDNNSNIFKVPTTIKKKRIKGSERSKIDVSKPTMFNNSNVTAKTTSHKINLIQKKIVKEKVETNIEDDIKSLSLHDETPQNTKLSDNLKGVPERHFDLKAKKLIVNTSVQNKKDDKSLQNFKPPQRTVFDKSTLNSCNLGNGLREVLSTSEFGMKKPLTITVSGKQQHMSSLVKGEKERPKINAYTVENLLKRFHINDEATSKRVENRLDEWVCWFYQVMEDCLSAVLMNSIQPTQKNLVAPWTFLEAVLCLKEAYPNDTGIKTVTDKLCAVLSNLSDKDDKLKKKIKPVDFMRLFGCGALLVEALKSTLPESAQVVESQKQLKTLLHHIEDPSTDIDLPFTPMRPVRSEIDEVESLKRNIVPKKPSEILGYLKTHFPAWKDFDERHLPPEIMKKQEKDIPKEQRVIRTLGKNLNTIKISHAKKITFDDSPANNTPDCEDNTKKILQKELPRITRTVDNLKNEAGKVNTENKPNNDFNKSTDKDLTTLKFKEFQRITRTFDNTQNDAEKINTKNKSNNDFNESTEKALTNLKDKTEANYWKDFTADVSSLDYEFETNNDQLSLDMMGALDDNAVPFVDGDKMGKSNDENVMGTSLFDGEINDGKPADDIVNCYDSTADSGFVNQSLDACSFIRLFLSELSATFKLIYTFIDDSIQEFRCDGVQLKDKKVLFDKANETHLYVTDIIGKLKRIVEREASDSTKLKSLILNAGVEALTDKRLTRYRQVTMKCLEQAQLLEGALKTMLALTNEHCDIAALDIDNNSHVPYFNIFE